MLGAGSPPPARELNEVDINQLIEDASWRPVVLLNVQVYTVQCTVTVDTCTVYTYLQSCIYGRLGNGIK